MKEIQLQDGKVIISKWMREGEDNPLGLKLSITDETHMVTMRLSFQDCEKVLVALLKERDAAKKNEPEIVRSKDLAD